MAKIKLSVSKKRVFVATICSYIVSGFSFLFGLAIALTSILNDHFKFIKTDDVNEFYQFVKSSGRWYGLLLIAVGAILFSLTIYLTARKSDKSEKLESTRKNRIQLNLENVENSTEE
jgi:hypothetical protein